MCGFIINPTIGNESIAVELVLVRVVCLYDTRVAEASYVVG